MARKKIKRRSVYRSGRPIKKSSGGKKKEKKPIIEDPPMPQKTFNIMTAKDKKARDSLRNYMLGK